ncbi:IPT/TIG domain-containing protein [Streptomyces kronopolitis]
MSVSANQAAPTLIGGPIITVLAPPFGSTAGNQVLIFGANLQNVTSVTFGGVPVPISVYGPLGLFLVVSAPPHAPGNVQVVVTSAAGSATTSYLYVGGPAVPPTATGITPATGPTTGGTPFTITGTNLTGASVTFNGVPATGLVIAPGGTSISGVTPPGTAGNATVQITTAGGTTTVPGGFTYTGSVLPPTTTGITPATGPTTGGTSFTITGTNLTGASVTFNGVPATGLVVAPGGTSVSGVTPPGTAGNATVQVTTAGGTTTVPGGFTYTSVILPPTATGIFPATGPTTGGTPFTIIGTNLTGASVTFNGVPATGLVVAPGGTSVSGVTPPGTAGNATVQVTTAGGTTTVPGGFTYTSVILPPTATGITPATGLTTGGTPFTITGTNLTGASVTFNGVPAPVTVNPGGTSITGVTPPGAAGTATVQITTAGGITTVPGGFTYVAPAPPTAATISPLNGSTNGGTPFTITGTNLTGASVTFNGVPATGIIVAPGGTSLSGITPAGAAGLATVVVTVPGGGSATVPGGFTYTVSPPTVTSATPAFGPSTGGNTVVITGTNFNNATSVIFGGVPATSFTIISPTQIQAVAPGGTGAAAIQVINPGGLSNAVDYRYGPIITNVIPTAGPAAGGNTVTIIGSNFTGATQVTFNGVPATSFTVNSDGQITAVAPPGSGAGFVRVTTPGGLSNPSPYSYAPTQQALSANSGPAAGGNTISIFGSNFTGATNVTFGGVPATSFVVVSPQEIQAVAPGGTGSAPVQVTTPGGTTPGLPYTYAPVIVSVNPSSVNGAGGATVTITGTNFTGVTAVNFLSQPATSFTVLSDTQIQAVAPAGVGSGSVTVTGPGGTSNAAPFSYRSSVTGLTPTFGPFGGGNTVILNGGNFTGATAVNFGVTPATSFTVLSDTQIQAVAPAGTGTVPVTVTTAGGVGNPQNYSYGPGIASFSPTFGPAAGGNTVTITGTNFTGATSVTFGGVPATSFTVLSPTQIQAVAPAGFGSGAVPIQVTTPGGISTAPGGYRYNPAIASVLPAQGPAAGGNAVTITGTNLTGVTSVTFNGTPATSFTVNSDSQITAIAPAGTGSGPVQLVGPGGASNTVAYSYAPALFTLSPNSGPNTGGNVVTINGTDLTGSTAVNFGASPAVSFSVLSDSQITAIAPAGAGTVSVSVLAPGGTSNTLPYTYV